MMIQVQEEIADALKSSFKADTYYRIPSVANMPPLSSLNVFVENSLFEPTKERIYIFSETNRFLEE